MGQIMSMARWLLRPIHVRRSVQRVNHVRRYLRLRKRILIVRINIPKSQRFARETAPIALTVCGVTILVVRRIPRETLTSASAVQRVILFRVSVLI